jgi:hypothetical protein
MAINFNDEDIKNAKIGLANQTLTSLQSAFLMQYIINLEQKEVNLIKYLEDKIKECKNTIELLEGTNSHRISILQVQIKSYEDILEKVRNGNYE